VRVRPVSAGEGDRLRELRLRALREAPDAFSSTPEQEETFGSADWEERARGVVVAEDGPDWRGMAGWYVDPDLPAIANLWGVWVDPAARGRGAGRGLVEAVAGAARAAGHRRIELGVTDRAPAAEALYAALGFRRTGVALPFPKRAGVVEAQMALAVLPPIPIETPRLRLRFTTPEDLEPLAALQARADVTRWLYWGPRDGRQVRDSLALKLAATRIERDGDAFTLAVETKDAGAYAGDVVLWSTSHEHRGGELGFILHPDHHGRGYATEAAAPLLELGFTCFGMRRIVGSTEVRNLASARVLEKLGMRREAHFVENELVKGEWQSEYVYALLEAEWRAAQSQLRRRK
jgi:RimJ/RimL family protein N-acetyltransferase